MKCIKEKLYLTQQFSSVHIFQSVQRWQIKKLFYQEKKISIISLEKKYQQLIVVGRLTTNAFPCGSLVKNTNKKMRKNIWFLRHMCLKIKFRWYAFTIQESVLTLIKTILLNKISTIPPNHLAPKKIIIVFHLISNPVYYDISK